MKVNGVDFKKEDAIFGPLPIQRGGVLHGFFAQPVWSMVPFYEVCPRPQPGPTEIVFTNKGNAPDFEHADFVKRLDAWKMKKWGWMTLTALAPSNITFDDVSLDDPDTWGNVEKALSDEFGHFEFQRLMDLVDEAQVLDDEKLAVNRETFLSQSRESESPSTSPNTDEATNS